MSKRPRALWANLSLSWTALWAESKRPRALWADLSLSCTRSVLRERGQEPFEPISCTRALTWDISSQDPCSACSVTATLYPALVASTKWFCDWGFWSFPLEWVRSSLTSGHINQSPVCRFHNKRKNVAMPLASFLLPSRPLIIMTMWHRHHHFHLLSQFKLSAY